MSMLGFTILPSPAEPIARDPVCGMSVTRSDAPSEEFHGTIYRFCNPRCREKFIAAPEKYLHPTSANSSPHAEAKFASDIAAAPHLQTTKPTSTAASQGGARQYICPMCPEVSAERHGP